MKKILLVKVLGSIALATSLLGIFVAVGGNLNLFNQNRTPIKPMQSNLQDSANKPKYSFYDELKQRKTELEKQQNETDADGNEAATATNDAEDSRLYLVQVGAFRDKSDAEKVVAKLEKLGYKGKIVKPAAMFLVQTGPFKGKALANSTEEKLKKDNFPTLIKHYNQ